MHFVTFVCMMQQKNKSVAYHQASTVLALSKMHTTTCILRFRGGSNLVWNLHTQVRALLLWATVRTDLPGRSRLRRPGIACHIQNRLDQGSGRHRLEEHNFVDHR